MQSSQLHEGQSLRRVQQFRTAHADAVQAANASDARKQLDAAIVDYMTRYNRTSRPFAWTATADSILAKLTRLATAISGTQH